MNWKITLPVILVLSIAAGYTYGVNTLHNGEENKLYSADKDLKVNETNPNGELTFNNNSLGIWYQEDVFYLDMDDDNSFESELSASEIREGDFVREIVRGEKAYQIYFKYKNSTEKSSASLQVYRIRQI
ncbi:MAG: hypothetical protein ACI977_000447 [Candidatus Nanohaloarchaea archaeon]|jgi:hypothetical protein